MNEIRISGFGGQGVIRCGYIIGRIAALFDNKHATLTQSFGPEARGSACSAQILVDKDPIRYPYVTQPDTVVTMSQEAYDKFGHDLVDGGLLLIDEDLVKPSPSDKARTMHAIPATRIAEQLGNRIAANIVMLGFFTAVADIISVDAARKALPTSVPERFIDLNLAAFERGYEYGSALLGGKPLPRPDAVVREPGEKASGKKAGEAPSEKAAKPPARKTAKPPAKRTATVPVKKNAKPPAKRKAKPPARKKATSTRKKATSKKTAAKKKATATKKKTAAKKAGTRKATKRKAAKKATKKTAAKKTRKKAATRKKSARKSG